MRKIKQLLFQQSFDSASNAGPLYTHWTAAVALLFLVLCSSIVPLALNHSDHRLPLYLRDHGISTTGVVDNSDVKTEFGVRFHKSYRTTVNYRFLGSDGKIYHGHSTYSTGTKPKPLATGDSITVVYDPSSPSTSGSQTALLEMQGGVFGAVFAAAVVLPWCVLFLYRYLRWRQRRRALPAT